MQKHPHWLPRQRNKGVSLMVCHEEVSAYAETPSLATTAEEQGVVAYTGLQTLARGYTPHHAGIS